MTNAHKTMKKQGEKNKINHVDNRTQGDTAEQTLATAASFSTATNCTGSDPGRRSQAAPHPRLPTPLTHRSAAVEMERELQAGTRSGPPASSRHSASLPGCKSQTAGLRWQTQQWCPATHTAARPGGHSTGAQVPQVEVGPAAEG